MGVGRRMKKQGPPASLEELFSERKRKPLGPARDTQRKRRKSSGANANTISQLDSKIVRNVSKPRNPEHHRIQAQTTEGSSVESDSIDDPDVLEDELDNVKVMSLDQLESSSTDDPFDDDELPEPGSRNPGGIWSDDEDEDVADVLNAANIEGLSRHLDARAAQEAAEAQAELEEATLQTNIKAYQPPPREGGIDEEKGGEVQSVLAPNLQLLRTRITDAIRILEDFSTSAEEGRSRADYVQDLLKDMCAYYGYSPFLCEKLFNLFAPKEAFAFFEANETPRPVVIRTNTLRTHRRELAQALINRGVTLEPVGKWSKIGLQVFESSVPLGATPEYLAGHYILQAASSFLPVMSLAPQEHERILDMASAPGGKATHISALMRNTGVVIGNDSKKSRAKALIGNIHRLGSKNTLVCNYDAREFPRVMGGFDRVLLDAPCSGTGVIAKDPSVKTNKSEKDFMNLPHLQKQLLLCAIDSVDHSSKTGGFVVYSTCSVTVEENEQVVQYALNKRPNVRLVDTGLSFGREGFANYMGKQFSPDMRLTRRYYPHAYNVDGFFVAKFKKLGLTSAGAVGTTSGTLSGSVVANGHQIEQEKNFDTPLVLNGAGQAGEDFGGWNEEEDQAYIERARAKSLRRKGFNPKASKPRTDTAVKQ